MSHVRTYHLGQYSALSQKILNELGAAKACLSDPPAKAQYDAKLRTTLLEKEKESAAELPSPSVPEPPPVAAWLEDFHPSLRRPAARTRPFLQRFSRRQKLALGILAGVVFLGMFGVMITLRTPTGTLVVEVSDPSVTVQVLSEKGEVQIEQAGQKEPITLAVDPGKHRLHVKKGDLEIFAKDFAIAAGGQETIHATWKRPAKSAPNSPAIAETSASLLLPTMLRKVPGEVVPEKTTWPADSRVAQPGTPCPRHAPFEESPVHRFSSGLKCRNAERKRFQEPSRMSAAAALARHPHPGRQAE